MPAESTASSRCLLVLGMHRSGTSAITRCLNLVGMDVGPHLLVPDGGNSKGYWEHADVVRINDAILESFGFSWWSLDPLPQGWLTSRAAMAARAEIQALVRRDFSGVPLWGIKDPRMCRLAPLWINVIGNMGIDVSAVFVARSPSEVARSLTKAHGLSEEAGVLLWIQHLAESERATRDLPRIMVSYDRVLDNTIGILDGIGKTLGISWPVAPLERRGALESFVDAGLRTHKSVSQGESAFPLVGRMVQMCDSLADAEVGNDWSTLSSVCEEAVELFDVLAYRRRALLPDEAARMHRVNQLELKEAHAKLYWAKPGQDFSEQDSMAGIVPFGRSQQAFKLVRRDFDRLRLDPADRPGYYRVHALTLVDAGGVVVWDWAGVSSDTTLTDIERVEWRDGAEVIYRFGEDPQIHLACPPEAARRPYTLVLDMERLDECRLTQEFDAWRIAARETAHLLQEEMRSSRLASEEKLHRLQEEMHSLRLASEENLRQLREEVRSSNENERFLREGIRTAEAERLSSAEILQQLAALVQGQQRHAEAAQALLRRGLWSKVRGRFARTEFRMQGTQHLEVVDTVARRYRVTGNDPIFTCESRRFPLAAGWYAVTLHMEQHMGRPAQPCLYPDYGSAVSSCSAGGEGMLFVRPGNSVHHGLVRFVHPVHAMRFDPAMAPCELSVSRLIFKRVGKARAAWELFKAWLRPMEVLGKPRPAWRSILGDFRKLGISGGIARLYEWYTIGDPRENSYDAWVALYDDVSPTKRRDATVRSETWSFRPLVSILVPTYNTDEKWLRRCLDSVLAQSYPHWELCIADDASPKAHVMEVLNEYVAKDSRINVKRRRKNGHISSSSNTALQMAKGEYIALLDHDDELHPLALHEMMCALQRHPQWKLIYSDEDKIDEYGRRYDPYMKPDWNYDLFLSQNCISHLSVYQRQLVLDVGGFREGYEGSQDWDLGLRCVEKLTAEEIGHVPRVLYHWRAISGSTAVGVGEKNYARDAALKAVRGHLKRIGADASVKEHKHALLKGQLRVSYSLPAEQPTVSLIIPTRDGLHLLKRCVDSILSLTDYENYNIVIIDNQSSERETLEYLREVVGNPRVRVLAYDEPFNYSALNNYAVQQTSSDLVGLVNNDIEVISPGWLREMVGHAMRPEIGAVGALLYYPDDTIQHAGVVLGFGGVAGHVYGGHPRGYIGQMGRAQLTQNLSAVTAACLVIRRSVFNEVAGLDEGLRVAFNDVDFCLRVRQRGYRNLWTPFAELYHHESATRGYEDSPEKQARFTGEVERMREIWGDQLDSDPAYSPNLTLTTNPFELAFPPRITD